MYVYATLNNNGCQISTFILVYFISNGDVVVFRRQCVKLWRGKQDISVLSILKPAVVGLHFKRNFRWRAEQILGLVRRRHITGTRRVWGGRIHHPGAVVGEVVAVQAAVSGTEPGCVHVVLVLVLVSGEKASLEQLDDFVIWEGHGRDIQTQHLGNDHPEIRQLQRRQEEALLWARGSVLIWRDV